LPPERVGQGHAFWGEIAMGAPTNEALIENLNGDLAGALGAMIQRITYASKTTSRFGRRLAEFFLSGLPIEQGHAQVLARLIVALGGEPTTVPRAIPRAETNREMLEALLATERQAIADLTGHMKDAEEYSEKTVAVDLGDMIREQTTQAERTERILRDW
jgi:bacterioferritin